jgi:hypothetical protein
MFYQLFGIKDVFEMLCYVVLGNTGQSGKLLLGEVLRVR